MDRNEEHVRSSRPVLYCASLVLHSLAFGFCEFVMPRINKQASARPGSTRLYLKYEATTSMRAILHVANKAPLARKPTAYLLDAAGECFRAFEEATKAELASFDTSTSSCNYGLDLIQSAKVLCSEIKNSIYQTCAKVKESTSKPCTEMECSLETHDQETYTFFSQQVFNSQSKILDFEPLEQVEDGIQMNQTCSEEKNQLLCGESHLTTEKDQHGPAHQPYEYNQDLDDENMPTSLWMIETLIQQGSLLEYLHQSQNTV